MKKRALSLLLAALMLVSFAACRGSDSGSAASAAPATEAEATDESGGEPAAEDTEEAEPAAGNYKIGIMTGTVSQGEEEFQTAQQMIAKHGADKIVTATYPDNFSTETETTISQVVALASDPDVKAIVFVQAVPGAAAAIDRVRETRPDMLFVCGVVAEDPATMASKADVLMLVDELGMGDTIPQQAADQGATTLIHYSFARHLSYATIAARREKMMTKCEELGIQYVDVMAPDPTGDSGVAGAQQFILEDVPRQVATYGKDTAFFSTNCSMQEPLIRAILEQGAVFPQQCCPSPYHGYPAALNIEVSGHEGDVQYMLDQITEKVAEGGNAGRMSTWPVPVNMVMVEAGVDYAIEFCEGRTSGAHDDAVFKSVVANVVKSYDGTIEISNYEDEQGLLDNFYMLLCDFYNF